MSQTRQQRAITRARQDIRFAKQELDAAYATASARLARAIDTLTDQDARTGRPDPRVRRKKTPATKARR